MPLTMAFVAKSQTFDVKIIGNYLDGISGRSQEQVDLKTIKLGPKTFGLGLEAETQAEIIVYKGKVYKSRFDNEGITTTKNKNTVASYLVYSRVKRWQKHQLPSTIRSLEDLEAEVAKIITENNLLESESIPFLVVGNPISANWHIELFPGTDRRLNNQGFFFQDVIKAVGFFASDQQGVITSSNSRIHIHVTNRRKEKVGHLDDIKMAGGMTLWVPKQK